MSYAWLAEKKKEAMAKKLQKRGMPSYSQLPIRERYGVNFTGYGPDGRLQREAPAGMDGKHIFHEGEMSADTPEGSMYVDSRTTKMAFPETEQQQAELKMFEKSGNLPGFKAGGFQPTVQPTKLAGSLDISNQIGNQGITRTAMNPPKPEIPNDLINIANRQQINPVRTAGVRTVDNQPVIQPILQGQQLVEPSVVKPVVAPEETRIAQPRVATEITKIPPAPNIQPILAGQNIPSQTVQPRTTDTPAATITPIRAAGQVNVDQKPVTPAKTTEDQAREAGMKWFLDALSKENPALLLEGRRAISELSSRQQQERSALEQQLIQQGVDPGRARVESAMLRDKQESERNNLAAQFGIAGMKSRQDIAGTLASQGLAGQQFEQERQKYKDSADWQAYDKAIAAGDFDTAAQAYQKVTGKPISMDQMKQYQNYLNTIRGQEITAGELSIQSFRNKIGDEKWDSIQSRINSGASLAQVNAEFPGLNISQQDFKNMYDATPLGERTWERNMSYAKILLEAGGAQNIQAAAGIFNQAFPGAGIDFGKLITADKAATFNTGMSQLSDLVASGMDYDAAIAVMKKNGTLDMMGMNEEEVEKVYRGMKVNAIDEQWKTISESNWYKGLPQQDQKDMSEFFTAVLSGKLDYSVQKEYSYVDASGKTVTKTFNTEGEAADFGKANNVTMTATGRSTVVPRTTTTSGTETTTTTKRTEPLGTVLVENGKILQVIADGGTQEIKPDVDDPWSPNNEKILLAGEKDNPYYKEIYDSRLKQAVNNGKTYEEAMNTLKSAATYKHLDTLGAKTVDTPLAENMLKYNFNYDLLKTLPYNDPLIQKIKKEIEASTKEGLKQYGKYFAIVQDGDSWKIIAKNV